MTEEEDAIIANLKLPFANLKFETEQSAWYARVLAAVVEFKEVYGRLPALKTSPSESKSKAEQKLAQELATVRQARRRNILGTRKAKDAQAVARRMLTAAEVEAWEAKLGNRIWVGTSATTDMYMPAADLKDDDKRHIFDRIPWCCEPVACYLCGYGVDSKESLIEHLKSDHYKGEDDLFTEERFFEEYRKRVFYYEETDGPFPVSGQEVRRAVSAHARHQTHSYPGTNKMNYEKPLKEGQGRSLGTCAICAMSAWQEELLQLDLFVKPADAKEEHGSDGEDAESGESSADDDPTEKPRGGRHSLARKTKLRARRAPLDASEGKLSILPEAVDKVNKWLSSERYHRRWERMPWREIAATSVAHPFGKEIDGTPWHWLLDTKSLPKADENSSGLRPDGTLAPDGEGKYPCVPACIECSRALCGSRPKLPRYALANDNLMLREPFVFRRHGEKLSPMTFAMLALARMVVTKIIAEKDRKADPATKQKGLRCNTICFPQARARELITESLPAEPAASVEFFADTISIALAGCNPEDLDKARWAEVPREAYMTAVRFCVAHSEAYEKIQIDEAEAAKRLSAAGRSCVEVLQQAATIETRGSIPFRLDGPADGEEAEIRVGEGVLEENGAPVDAEMESEEKAVDEEELPNDLPDIGLHCAASGLSSADLDTTRAAQEFAAKLELLMQQINGGSSAGTIQGEVQSMIELARTLGTDEYLKKMDELIRSMDHAEGKPESRSTELHARKDDGAYILYTGRRPLSMYDKELWQKAFPHLFPYGDGVFGIVRETPMTFQQWATMMLLRTELEYQVPPDDPSAGFRSKCPLATDGREECAQCQRVTENYVPPSQPRWSADLTFQCVLYDTWRRMEIIRRAGAHVRRKNFQADLKIICKTTACEIAQAFEELGPKAGVKEIVLSNKAPTPLKEALKNVLLFSSEVVGSDGARQQLRHEQTGDMLRFGGIGGFLTANVADTRHPIVVLLHAGALNHTDGGLMDDGKMERYSVDLLDECPSMPAAEEMLRIIARDPVAQARFFILSMRLFCEHVLGTGPFDSQLRHNAAADGVVYPDGYAASLLGAAMNLIASLHGPIEEQARLSCHSHMVFQYINRQSQAWLRAILRKETVEARAKLRAWQEAVIAAVEALQVTASAIVPLHFVDDPQQAPPLRSTPYLGPWRVEDRFDGALEGDKKYPTKRRADVPAVAGFRDHHVRAHVAQRPPDKQNEPVSERRLSLKGSVMSRLPHYRVLPERTPSCACRACQERHLEFPIIPDSAEATAYAEAFANDHYEICSLSGHIHRHHDTCFKYIEESIRRKPQHCRFGFVHFVRLWLPKTTDAEGEAAVKEQLVQRLLARVGKEPVLPRQPGERKGDIYAAPVVADRRLFTTPGSLGASVEADDRQAKRGRIKTVVFNPREGSTTMGGVPAHRGNLDYQDARKTLVDGFDDDPRAVDCLRCDDESSEQAPEVLAGQSLRRMDFRLVRSLRVLWDHLQRRRLPQRLGHAEVDSHDDDATRICARLETFMDDEDRRRLACLSRAAGIAEVIPRRGASEVPRIGDRYVSGTAQWIRRNVVDCVIEGIRSGIQTSFYICDYSTKPNMTCAPLLKNMAHGMEQLDATLKEEAAQMKLEELLRQGLLHGKHLTGHSADNGLPEGPPLKKTKVSKEQDEARRRLIRLWSSANNAVVKGCCLMALQLLTRREVVRTHRHWRVLMKRPLWSAHEALRQTETGLQSDAPAQDHRLDLLVVPPVNGNPDDGDGAVKASAAIPCSDSGERALDSVNLSTQAFYDDWLHRGQERLLLNMNHYVYAMFVAKVSRCDALSKGLYAYEFDEHYGQAANFVQVILDAPRTPYLHGITMPTRAKDPATNALVHQILLRPTRCPGKGYCCNPVAHSAKYFTATVRKSMTSLSGVSRPLSTLAKPVSGQDRFVHPWKAYEAELQMLARRADEKLRFGRSRRVPVLPDTTCQRQWFLLGAEQDTMVQRWLTPWLLGAGRRLYQRPWLGGGLPPSGPAYDSLGRPLLNCRPRYRQRRFMGPGFLQPLPEHAAYEVLRFIGHVKVEGEDGVEEALLIANSATAVTELDGPHSSLDLARAAAQRMGHECAHARFTSLGVHDDQLFPEEFFAFISVETGSNLDFMAEARRRPRPSQLHADAVMDDEKDLLGLRPEKADVEDLEGEGAEQHFPDDPSNRKPLMTEGVRYKPYQRLADEDVFATVHRSHEVERTDARAGDKHERLQLFMENHKRHYATLRRPCSLLPPLQSRDEKMFPEDVAKSNAALVRQRALKEARNKLESQGDPDVVAATSAGMLGPDGEDDPGDALFVADVDLPESPAEYARGLVAKRLPAPVESGDVFKVPEDQYHAVILAVEPLQRLWDWAGEQGRRNDFKSRPGLLKLLAEAPINFVRRTFFHGPGGSGKTFSMTEVVLPVYQKFCPGCARASAAQNSAARLIGGSTFHYMAALTRFQALTGKKPSRPALRKLQMLWGGLALKLMDESSLIDPQLLAVLNENASWARAEQYSLDTAGFVENPFGNILMQLLLGDFMQLNPVRSHTLLEAFLAGTDLKVPRVPTYEKLSEDVRKQNEALDQKGYRIFDVMSQTVVLFRGSFRFKKGDALPQLLEIMRTIGGAPVPEWLRKRIGARVRQNTSREKRDQPEYMLKDADGKQVGPKGFFAQGFHSAVNWDQVARLQHIWAVHSARLSLGPVAYQNTRSGAPQRLRWDFPPAASSRARASLGEKVHARLAAYLQVPGQLLYYVQAVDIPHQHAYKDRTAVYQQALEVANMTVTCGLMSVFVFFHGMRMKLTKKIMAPELVQECPGECVGVAFHEEESFGWGRARGVPVAPPSDHPCWQTGYVLLDRLPRYLEFRADGAGQDYTGLGKPGVWHLEPTCDEWVLHYKLHYTINHPCSTPKRMKKTNSLEVQMTRCQVPAAPERVGTFQNMQGKTVRGPDKEPLGHTIDLHKPDYFHGGEYKQHLYMILGRATSLDYCLFDNFPMDEDGFPDWHWFEEGPPDYLVHFLEELERRAATSRAAIETARQRLRIFPPWEHVPESRKLDEGDTEFAYNRETWDEQVSRSGRHSEADPSPPVTSKRILGKRRAEEITPVPSRQTGEDSLRPASDAAAQSASKRRRENEHCDSDGVLKSPLPPPPKATAFSDHLSRAPPPPKQPATTEQGRPPPPRPPKQPSKPLPEGAPLVLPRREVSAGLRNFVRQTLECEIHVREAGGEGDCLFLSIAACLRELCDQQRDASALLEGRAGLSVTALSNLDIAGHLRKLVAQQLHRMEPETFLDLVLTLVFTERTQGARWQEGWSPRQELCHAGLQTLLTANNVVAVSANEYGRPEDLVILYRQGNIDTPWACSDGMTKLTALRGAVADRFAQMGQTHWGTTTDIGLLSEALNIGFVVFSSQMQGQGRWIYGLNLKRTDYPFWVLVYNSGLVHFQVAVLSALEGSAPYRSVYRSEDVPDALAQHFALCSGMPMGQRDQGGVN